MNDREYQRMYQTEDEHWWYVALHELILRHVSKEACNRPLSIFDAGCGTGRLCQLLSPYGEVTGCDISGDAIAFSRKRGLSNVWSADLNSADLGKSRYDVITAIDVLYHRQIHDDSSVLASFHQALRPGGLLILNLVAFEFLRSSHDLAVHTRQRYRRSGTVAILEDHGFLVETAAYRLAFLFFPILCYRLARRLLTGTQEPAAVDSDLFLPPPLINRLLLSLSVVENSFIQRGFGPFGTSLFITARKAS